MDSLHETEPELYADAASSVLGTTSVRALGKQN